MAITARSKFLRISTRKACLVAERVRSMQVEDALNYLRYCPKKSAKYIGKVLKTAVANAKADKTIDVDNLYVGKILIDGGPMMKRFMPKAQGRATTIRKRTSHITIELKEI